MHQPTEHDQAATSAHPAPTPGCDVCAALAKQRTAARLARDYSRVTDCDVEMRHHQHGNSA